MEEMFTVALIGHRDLSSAPVLSPRIEEIVAKVIREHEMVEFYFVFYNNASAVFYLLAPV